MTTETIGSSGLKQYVLELISSSAPGSMLPSDRSLCRHFGISERTVRRAMTEFARQELIVRIQGKGTMVPGGQDMQAGIPHARTTSAETIADRIEELIQNGVLKAGDSLPKIKFISLSYGVAPETVIRAYRILSSRSMISRAGRRCFVGALRLQTSPVSVNRTIVFDPDGSGFGKAIGNDGMAPAFLKFERELAANGHAVEYRGQKAFDEFCSTQLVDGNKPAAIVVGRLKKKRYEEITNKLISTVRKIGRHFPPALVLSDAAPPRPPREILLLCHGNIATTWARRLARFLFDRNLSKVVLFHNSANPVQIRSFASHLKIGAELLSVNKAAAFEIVEKRSTIDRVDISKNCSEIMDEEMLRPLMNKYTNAVSRIVSGRPQEVLNFRDAFPKYLDSSVWLFSHDQDAADALAFCAEQNIAVPGRVSIIALQNDLDYLGDNLTVCTEDFETIGYLMAHAVLGDLPVARTSRGYLRPAAMVLERRTTPVR